MKMMQLMGNIGNIYPPERDGQPVKFSICVDKPVKRGNTWKTVPEWFQAFAFDHAASAILNHCSRGSQILAVGVPEMQSWTTQDGANHSRMAFRVQRVTFGQRCGSRRAEEQAPHARPDERTSARYHRRSRGDDLDNPMEK